MVNVLQARALDTPERRAYTFLESGEEEGALHLTYAELDRRSRALACRVQTFGAGPALILCPPGLDFTAAFFACLYAGAPAVPAYPPGSRRGLSRLQAVARDARPATVLTTSGVLARTAGWLDRSTDLPPMRWLTVNDPDLEAAEGWKPFEPAADDLAFLQYTSGSTATPKGVMVSHGNLIHNQALIRDACRHSESSVFVSWLPLFHDLGLIGNFLQAAFVGAPCVLMAPAAFLQRPLRWLQAVSRHRATTSGGPDFAYDLCARRIPPEQREGLDLGSWEVAFNGAEPVRAATLRRFAEAFAPCGFRERAFFPCYGLAEATLMVSGGRPEEPPVIRAFDAGGLERGEAMPASTSIGGIGGRELVGCGGALGGQSVSIVEASTGARLGPGRIGEIWIAGPSVALGYWNRPEETAEAFGAWTAAGEGPFLRTGDLGFFDGGELFVAGRLKDLIILRGRNLYPQDVEAAAERSCPGLAPGSAAAFAVDFEGEERLAMVVELPRRPSLPLEAFAERIRTAVAEELEAHVHEVALVPPGALPRTSSGKVQRRLCRTLLLEDRLELRGRSVVQEASPVEEETGLDGIEPLVFPMGPVAERRQALERWLRGRIAGALRVAPYRLDPSRPLVALGLDSLAAMEVRGRIEEGLGLFIGLEELLDGATLDGLVDRLLREAEGPRPTPVPIEAAMAEGAEMPLSSLQEALWFLRQLAPESSAYHVTFAARLDGEVDADAFRQAFESVVKRHASLRTTFHLRDGRPVQRLREETVPLLEVDTAGWSEARLEARLEEEAHRPFDLERGPVLRAVLFRRPEGGSVFLLAVHHLVFDGWSLWLLLGELGVCYEAARDGGRPELPPLRRGYFDFVSWQRARLASEGERLWQRWQPRLAGIPPLELPVDIPRKPAAVRPGGSHTFRVQADRVRGLRALAAGSGATLPAVVLAAFEALLFRYTGQEEFLIGVAVSGRSRPVFEPVVGCFFNVVPVPAAVSPGLTFGEHLRRTSRSAQESIALQDYPSHLLAERLRAGDAGLFQATFIWQKPQRLVGSEVELDAAGHRLFAPGLPMEPLPVGRRFARQELELEVIEADEALLASFRYDAGLFRATTVARMAGHLDALLRAVAADPGLRLSDLPLLDEPEEHLLRIELSGAGEADGPARPGSVADLFAEQVHRNPDHPAAVHPDQELTYRQLDRRSEELAALLRSLAS